MSEQTEQSCRRILCIFDVNSVVDVTYKYTMKLIKASSLVAPEGTVYTGCVCFLRVGDIECSSNTSSMIGTDHSKIFI